MRGPDRPGIGSTGYSDDRPRGGCRAVCRRLPAGGGSGGGVRFFLPTPETASPFGRRIVFVSPVSHMALPELWDLPGRSAAGGQPGADPGHDTVGQHRRKTSATAVFRILEASGPFSEIGSVSLEKNLQKSKNFVCISRKMGYNKME